MSRALLLIDLQVDFLSPTGRLPVAASQAEPLLASVWEAYGQARRHGDPIFAIGNEFERSDFIANIFRRFSAMQGSPGAAWDPRAPREGAEYFSKSRGDAFSNRDLAPRLEDLGVASVVLCGVYASACVLATARAALRHRLQVQVLRAGVADRSLASRERALARLSRAGVQIIDRY